MSAQAEKKLGKTKASNEAKLAKIRQKDCISGNF